MPDTAEKGIGETESARGSAVTLLRAIQRAVPLEMFQARNYWRGIEGRLRASVQQNVTLPSAVEQLMGKLQVESVRHEDLENFVSITESDNADEILREYREHTSLIIAHVRLRSQQEREEYATKKLDA